MKSHLLREGGVCDTPSPPLPNERVNRRQYRTRAEARADSFDYIERWHNPRQRRRLELQQQREKLFTQLSVETG